MWYALKVCPWDMQREKLHIIQEKSEERHNIQVKISLRVKYYIELQMY